MNARAKRIVIGAGVLVVLQAAAISGYLAVQRGRSEQAALTRATSFAADQLIEGPAPALTGERRDGSRVSLAELRGKHVLVHFWATWCPPCLRELPGLLAAAAERSATGHFALLAVSMDDNWEDVVTFFAGAIPPVVLRPSEVEMPALFGVSTLPDTYLVDPEGNVIQRYAGERDWTSAEMKRRLDEAMGDGAARRDADRRGE